MKFNQKDIKLSLIIMAIFTVGIIVLAVLTEIV